MVRKCIFPFLSLFVFYIFIIVRYDSKKVYLFLLVFVCVLYLYTFLMFKKVYFISPLLPRRPNTNKTNPSPIARHRLGHKQVRPTTKDADVMEPGASTVPSPPSVYVGMD